MPADWWARGIAIGGSAVASLNMIVSYRTFRRVRPKVKVRLWRTGLSVSESGIDGGRHVFILRFLNNGTTPVSVERIELWTSPKYHKRADLVHGKRFERGVTAHEPPVVPALDGTVYRYSVPRSAMPVDGMRTRFRVLLTNGRVAYSPPVPSGIWHISDEIEEATESHPAERDE